jgi:hypothetical protein
MALSREELDKQIAEKKLVKLTSSQKTILKWLITKCQEGKPLTLDVVLKNYGISDASMRSHLDPMEKENLLHYKTKIATGGVPNVVETTVTNPYIVVTGIGRATAKLMG